MTPEEKARQQIDELLNYAGWDVQNREELNLFDPDRPGVAIHEAHLKTGFADYLLFVEGKALGVILDNDQLHWLTEQGKRTFPTSVVSIWSAVYAYDLRGGAVETAIKGSKQGRGITKRNKKSFYGQEMLLLLGQLAYNLTAWVRNGLAFCQARLQQFGMLRMVRDAFHIAGSIGFDVRGHIVQISLNQAHDLAASFIDTFAPFLARDGTVTNLRQI